MVSRCPWLPSHGFWLPKFVPGSLGLVWYLIRGTELTVRVPGCLEVVPGYPGGVPGYLGGVIWYLR